MTKTTKPMTFVYVVLKHQHDASYVMGVYSTTDRAERDISYFLEAYGPGEYTVQKELVDPT